MDALARVRRAPGRRPAGDPPPYRGLASFQAEDAQWFFGRDDLTRLLVDLAAERPGGGAARGTVRRSQTAPGTTRPNGRVSAAPGRQHATRRRRAVRLRQVVVLRAGLVPALRARAAPPGTGGPRLLLFTPGAHPIRAFAGQLVPDDADAAEATLRTAPWRSAELAGKIRPPGLAVIVDQFEEIFTKCESEASAGIYLGALRARLPCPGRARPAGLLLRPRAHLPAARGSLTGTPRRRGADEPSQLRSAIVQPARVARLTVEDGLVEVLLRDLAVQAQQWRTGRGVRSGGTSAALPAMLTIWERSRGTLLTVAAYDQSGGVRNALARNAETAFGKLTADQGRQAQRLFLRLVQITDGAVGPAPHPHRRGAGRR